MVRAARPGSRWTASRIRRRAAYDEYMRSPEWAALRREWFEEERSTGAPAACAVCGATTTLELHHLDYQRLGAERHEDLVALCAEHHKRVHDVLDASSQWRRLPRRTASMGIIATMSRPRQGPAKP